MSDDAMMTPVVEEMPGNHPTTAPESAPRRPERRSRGASPVPSWGGIGEPRREARTAGMPNRPVSRGKSTLCPIPSHTSESGRRDSMQVSPSMPDVSRSTRAVTLSRRAVLRTCHTPCTRTVPEGDLPLSRHLP